MTKEQKIKVLAELDGYSLRDESAKFPEFPDWQTKLAVYQGESFVGLLGGSVNFDSYLTSYDAIIPLVQRQPFLHCFLDNLCIITNGDSAEMDGSYKELIAMWKASPEQLSDALIKAVGKWEE